MGKHQSLTINIPEPCTEAWNNMLPEDKGRFCLSCRKKVIDFSGMSDNEILQTLKAAGKNTCGRFETTQLDRLVTPQKQPSAPFFPTALLVTLLGAIVPETGKAQQNISISATVPNPSDTYIPTCIDGRIIDAETGDGVRSVTIALKGSSSGSISDKTGYFRFNMPEGHHELPVFSISCIGYDAIEFTPDPSQTLPFTISLNKATNNLREINVIAYQSYKMGKYVTGAVTCTETTTIASHHRDSWWYRLTRIFRKNEKSIKD